MWAPGVDPRRFHPETVARAAAAVRRLRLGDPEDPSTDVGGLVTAAQRDRVADYVRLGTEEGAVVAAQAPLPAGPRWAGASGSPRRCCGT